MSYKVSISMHGNLRFVISMAVWDFSVGWFDRFCAAAKRSQPLHPVNDGRTPLICSRLFSFVRIIAWNKIAWPSGGCLRCVKAKRFSAFNSNPPLSIAGAGHFQRSFSQAEGEVAAERRRPCLLVRCKKINWLTIASRRQFDFCFLTKSANDRFDVEAFFR